MAILTRRPGAGALHACRDGPDEMPFEEVELEAAKQQVQFNIAQVRRRLEHEQQAHAAGEGVSYLPPQQQYMAAVRSSRQPSMHLHVRNQALGWQGGLQLDWCARQAWQRPTPAACFLGCGWAA